MKQITSTLILLMTKLFIQAQVITVTATTLQNFNHTSTISTIEAMTLDVIEYPNYTVGENIFVFDLSNRRMTLNGGSFCEIAEININENILDCVVMDNGLPVLYLIGETSDGQSQFLMEWIEGDKVFGEFSMNSDFSYTKE